ncbi:hypothetical protein IAF30_21090, partial [Acinetobacter baumannii]|nr:hypothetical protein [Acinetobacter baumannii]
MAEVKVFNALDIELAQKTQDIVNAQRFNNRPAFKTLNTLPSWFRPGPMNNLNRGGLFGRYSNGQLQLQFAAAAKLND